MCACVCGKRTRLTRAKKSSSFVFDERMLSVVTLPYQAKIGVLAFLAMLDQDRYA
jgi:hypothetical protein